ncbi:hypothetical protein HYH03_010161 [Edaphochlamys debaryana]|nr:hypothetical protein HYH03_010161 [Edaphochlamys debaryana]|eukprot:KAG2491594.1 hypothetical protein HYH03_010161 [Edaphochlamys debaryana]
MLVLENHSDLVKVVSTAPPGLDAVSSLRNVTASLAAQEYDPDEDAPLTQAQAAAVAAAAAGGPHLTTVSPHPPATSATSAAAKEQPPPTVSPPPPLPPRLAAEASAADREVARILTPPLAMAAPPAPAAAAAAGGGAAKPSGTSAGSRLSPTSSFAPGSLLSYTAQPLTLAASASRASTPTPQQSHATAAAAAATASSGGGTAAAAGARPASSMAAASLGAGMSNGTASMAGQAAAAAGTAGPLLAAGQVHAPPASPYSRPAAAPGTPGTAGAVASPMLGANSIVQPASSPVTAAILASREAAVMSPGALAAAPAAAAAAGSANGGVAGDEISGAASPQRMTGYADAAAAAAAVAAAAAANGGRAPTPPLILEGTTQDSVVILPKMVSMNQGAIFDSLTNGAALSPRTGARLAALGPAAAAAAAAAAANISGGGVAGPVRSVSPPAAQSGPLPPLASYPALGAGGLSASLPALHIHPTTSTSHNGAASPTHGGQAQSPTNFRPTARSTLDVPAGAAGVSRDLLGYFATETRIKTAGPTALDGYLFTGGIGGRAPRYGGSGGRLAAGAANHRAVGAWSLRQLAGVNDVPRFTLNHRMGRRRAASLKVDQGPDLPLELDASAPPLRHHKLSEPSLEDVQYILGRWTTKWAQERTELNIVSRLGPRPHQHHQHLQPGAAAAAAAGPGLGGSAPAGPHHARAQPQHPHSQPHFHAHHSLPQQLQHLQQPQHPQHAAAASAPEHEHGPASEPGLPPHPDAIQTRAQTHGGDPLGPPPPPVYAHSAPATPLSHRAPADGPGLPGSSFRREAPEEGADGGAGAQALAGNEAVRADSTSARGDSASVGGGAAWDEIHTHPGHTTLSMGGGGSASGDAAGAGGEAWGLSAPGGGAAEAAPEPPHPAPVAPLRLPVPPRLQTPMELSQFGFSVDDLDPAWRAGKLDFGTLGPAGGAGPTGPGAGPGPSPGQDEPAVGVGDFRRPLADLGLFGAPYLGGTPRQARGGNPSAHVSPR